MIGLSSLGRRALLALLPLAVLVSPAAAQSVEEYPARPVKLLVGFSPGASTDIFARLIANRVQKNWPHSIVVENKGGAAGVLATQELARSRPDGYTLMFVTSSHVTNSLLYDNIPYDITKDFAGVTIVSTSPQILMVHPDVPVKTIADLIALAKSKPGAMNYGSGGIGSAGHLSMELFNVMAGLKMEHIPFRGGNLAVLEAISGRIPIYFGSVAASRGPIDGKQLKPLAVSSLKRIAVYPELPPIADTLPGFETTIWYGFLAPAGTPAPLLNKIQKDVVAALGDESITSSLQKDGATAVGTTPQEFDAQVLREFQVWKKVFTETGLKGGSVQ